MKVFGIILITIGIISFFVVTPFVKDYNFKQALASADAIIHEKNLNKNLNTILRQYPELNEYEYTKYSRIAGGIGVVFGLFCFFLGMSLEKKKTNPKPNFDL